MDEDILKTGGEGIWGIEGFEHLLITAIYGLCLRYIVETVIVIYSYMCIKTSDTNSTKNEIRSRLIEPTRIV